jgi:hypothetical protein
MGVLKCRQVESGFARRAARMAGHRSGLRIDSRRLDIAALKRSEHIRRPC